MFQYLLLLESDEDKEFFTEIYQKYRKEMFYTAYNILHNPSDAEDIVHETFLSLIDHVDKIKNSEPHKAWYYINTAVKRKCYTFYRRQHLREEVELDETWMREEEIIEKGPDSLMEEFELQEAMTGVLKKLKSPYKEVLAMQYYYQLTTQEIADELGTTPDNVRHISMRAKRKLQTILEEHGLWNEKGGSKSKTAQKKPGRKKSARKSRKEEKGEEE